MSKVYVKVTAEHDINGQVRPILMTWVDERKYVIDRVLDVRQAASLKSGGQGIRYTCRICGKQVYLFDEEGRWFIES